MQTNFKEVYETYVEDVYRLCFSFLKNPMDTDDAVQETFMKFYNCKKEFSSQKHMKAWLIVTASNYCKDVLKQWWRKNKNIEDYSEIIGDTTSQMDEMMELVMKLPDKYKTVVYMYYYEGYDSAEIAKMLHKPNSTIRSYLATARKLLKLELLDEGGRRI